jgi:hypothetical protein
MAGVPALDFEVRVYWNNITTQINLLKFHGEIKAIAKCSLELRNTKNGTRVITREMADHQVIKNQLE